MNDKAKYMKIIGAWQVLQNIIIMFPWVSYRPMNIFHKLQVMAQLVLSYSSKMEDYYKEWSEELLQISAVLDYLG